MSGVPPSIQRSGVVLPSEPGASPGQSGIIGPEGTNGSVAAVSCVAANKIRPKSVIWEWDFTERFKRGDHTRASGVHRNVILQEVTESTESCINFRKVGA